MGLLPGFQKSAYLKVQQGLPGDLGSGRTVVNLAANGYFALGPVTVGVGCFLATSGTQVCTASSDAGTTTSAGIVLRNQGLAQMSWSDSQQGYGFTVPDGGQPSVANGGDILVILTGVDTSGAANHTPVVGDVVWQKLTDGTLASAPSSVSTVTGYIRLGTFRVTLVGLLTSATVSTNQTFGQISGTL